MRHIHLKEWGINIDGAYEPTDLYISHCDGSLLKQMYNFRTDKDGFIITGNDRIDPSSRPIVILGDSVVENMYVREDRRMCSVLERELISSGHSLRILNAGMSGATTLHLLNMFLNKIVPLRPKIVILMSGIFDVTAALNIDSFWASNKYLTPIRSQHEESDDFTSNQLPAPDWDTRERLLRAFVATSAALGVPLYLATTGHRTCYDAFAMRTSANVESNFTVQRDWRLQSNTITKTIAAETGSLLIDVEDLLYDRSDVFYDYFHLNEFGSKLVGEKLADILSIQNGITSNNH